MSPIPTPQWVQNLASVSPLIVGVAGIVVGRKTKVATDELKLSDLTTRIVALEGVQAQHVISIAKLQQNVKHINESLARIEDSIDTTQQMTSEVRGMLYAMQGMPVPPPPVPMNRRRRLPSNNFDEESTRE